MVHGDDFVTLGLEEQIKWFHESMQSTYEVTIRGVLGPEAKDDKRIEILNRVVEWVADGITYEGDPRHAIALIKGMGVEQGKGVAAPGVKSKDDDEEGDDEELGRNEANEFRSLAARANFLAQDRVDIQYSVKRYAAEWQGRARAIGMV